MTNIARLSYYLLSAMRRLNWDEEMMHEHQNRELRKVVKNAYDNVPFYRRLFESAKIQPSDIRTVADLNKLPIIRKTDMKKASLVDLISKEYSLSDLKVLRTGGSTGQPLSIYINRKEDDWRKAIYMRANISCGQRPRDRWVAVTEPERVVDTTGIQHMTGIFAQTVVPVVWNRADQLGLIEKVKPDILDGYSGMLWLLANEAELRNIKSIRPRIIFGTAELIDQSSRRRIEKVFGAPFYDQFGCTEIDRSAWQCPERESYHMDTDSVIMQFVDEEGQEVGPGERGEIVYTSLFNYAMPFIRYNVEDIGIPANNECPCGRKLPLMKIVEGRNNSFLFFSNRNVVSPLSFIEVLRAYNFTNEIKQYRIIQEQNDLVKIYIKTNSDDIDEEKIRRGLLDNILEGLPKLISEGASNIRFEIEFVDDIPLTQRGKLNVISSRVQTNLMTSQ